MEDRFYFFSLEAARSVPVDEGRVISHRLVTHQDCGSERLGFHVTQGQPNIAGAGTIYPDKDEIIYVFEGSIAVIFDGQKRWLNADPKYLLQGEFTEPSGYEAGLRLLQLDPRPDAVFVGNDRMAVGVMGAFHDSGVDVPGEIAIAGFDDIEMSQYLSPALTTVHADAQRLGALAVSRLLELQRTSKVDGPRHEVLPTTLVVRGSCGALDVDSANARIHRNDIQTPSESARRDRR
jgi:DNA-binding LacI/PurR family transcriptional regulator